MIRYDVSVDQIEQAIRLDKPTWLDNAVARTEELKAKKKYEEASSIWGDVKPIYMHIQNCKCIFCERQLEGTEYGTIEHDLEHFRPKSSVKVWPPKKLNTDYSVNLGSVSKTGYYWLAYDILNYAACCKVCNTPLKSNFFPVGGKRKTTPVPLASLKSEKPYLCYPIGNIDDDPENLVTFIATTAIPAKKNGHAAARGKIIIDFFQLNSREQLHRERARCVTFLGSSLKSLEIGNDIEQHKLIVSTLLQPSQPHAACSRAFNSLWKKDKVKAKKIHQACLEYFASQTNSVPPV